MTNRPRPFGAVIVSWPGAISIGALLYLCGCVTLHSVSFSGHFAGSGRFARERHISESVRLIAAGDSKYIEDEMVEARALYVRALDAVDSERVKNRALAAGWRLLVLATLAGDREALQQYYEDIFMQRIEGRTRDDWLGADFIAAWAMGMCSDEELPEQLERLQPGAGRSVAWFLVGEHKRCNRDSEAAEQAFQNAARGSSNVAVWGDVWAKRRLELLFGHSRTQAQ